MATLTNYTGGDAFTKRNPRPCDPDKFRIRPIALVFVNIPRSTGVDIAFDHRNRHDAASFVLTARKHPTRGRVAYDIAD